jgi:hypothetical protein
MDIINIVSLNLFSSRLNTPRIRETMAFVKLGFIKKREKNRLGNNYFFFDKSKCIKERKRGATHSTQGVYKGKPK